MTPCLWFDNQEALGGKQRMLVEVWVRLSPEIQQAGGA